MAIWKDSLAQSRGLVAVQRTRCSLVMSARNAAAISVRLPWEAARVTRKMFLLLVAPLWGSELGRRDLLQAFDKRCSTTPRARLRGGIGEVLGESGAGGSISPRYSAAHQACAWRCDTQVQRSPYCSTGITVPSSLRQIRSPGPAAQDMSGDGGVAEVSTFAHLFGAFDDPRIAVDTFAAVDDLDATAGTGLFRGFPQLGHRPCAPERVRLERQHPPALDDASEVEYCFLSRSRSARRGGRSEVNRRCSRAARSAQRTRRATRPRDHLAGVRESSRTRTRRGFGSLVVSRELLVAGRAEYRQGVGLDTLLHDPDRRRRYRATRAAPAPRNPYTFRRPEPRAPPRRSRRSRRGRGDRCP